jgi:hypothetical protein
MWASAPWPVAPTASQGAPAESKRSRLKLTVVRTIRAGHISPCCNHDFLNEIACELFQIEDYLSKFAPRKLKSLSLYAIRRHDRANVLAPEKSRQRFT